MSNGFRVETIVLEEFARTLGKELTLEPYKNTPFVAEQLRFSDYEVEYFAPAASFLCGSCQHAKNSSFIVMLFSLD